MDTPAPVEAPLPAAAPAVVTMPWQDYQASRQDWFKSAESFKWFQRQHQAELVKLGALAVIAGRVFVVPQAFDAAVVAIGQRLAQQRAA